VRSFFAPQMKRVLCGFDKNKETRKDFQKSLRDDQQLD
jgi:hypothetical protein